MRLPGSLRLLGLAMLVLLAAVAVVPAQDSCNLPAPTCPGYYYDIYRGAESTITRDNPEPSELRRAMAALTCDQVTNAVSNARGQIKAAGNQFIDFHPHLLLAVGYKKLGCYGIAERHLMQVDVGKLPRSGFYAETQVSLSGELRTLAGCADLSADLEVLASQAWPGYSALSASGKAEVKRLQGTAGQCASGGLAKLEAEVRRLRETEAGKMRALFAERGGEMTWQLSPASADRWRDDFAAAAGALVGLGRDALGAACTSWASVQERAVRAARDHDRLLGSRTRQEVLAALAQAGNAPAACGASKEPADPVAAATAVKSGTAQLAATLESVQSLVKQERESLMATLDQRGGEVKISKACAESLGDTTLLAPGRSIAELRTRIQQAGTGNQLLELAGEVAGIPDGSSFAERVNRSKDRRLAKGAPFVKVVDEAVFTRFQNTPVTSLDGLCTMALQFEQTESQGKRQQWNVVVQQLDEGEADLKQVTQVLQVAAARGIQLEAPDCIEPQLRWKSSASLVGYSAAVVEREQDFSSCVVEAKQVVLEQGVQDLQSRRQETCARLAECGQIIPADDDGWAVFLHNASLEVMNRFCAGDQEILAALGAVGDGIDLAATNSTLGSCSAVAGLNDSLQALASGNLDHALVSARRMGKEIDKDSPVAALLKGTHSCVLVVKGLAFKPGEEPREWLTSEARELAGSYLALRRKNESLHVKETALFPAVCSEQFSRWQDERSG